MTTINTDRVFLVQKDYGSEGYADIAACPTQEVANALAAQLMAMDPSTRILVDSVPVVNDPAEARLEILTIHQDVLAGNALGDYTETRRTVWTFYEAKLPAPVTAKATKREITVFGTNHAEVRETFSEAVAGYPLQS